MKARLRFYSEKTRPSNLSSSEESVMKYALRPFALFAALVLTAFCGVAAPIKSVGTMTFSDANTLIVADWRGGQLHAISLPPAAAGTGAPFNLKNVSAPIAKALRTQPESLRFEDMAVRPGSQVAYMTVSVQEGSRASRPALVSIDASGSVKVLDLNGSKHTSVTVPSVPSADKTLWRDTPLATLTVTDMVFHQGKLFVAGLSNATFASTLRVFDFPFSGTGTVSASVEMYHPVHNQNETRAPIRKMAIVDIKGEPTIVAAFTCTPLVTVPVREIRDGAHIVGRTIAELGWGSAPVDMVTFDTEQGPVVLLTNSHKAADLIPVAAIADSVSKPGLKTPIKFPAEPLAGVRSTYIPMAGIAQLSVQNNEFLVGLRRNEASGAMELVSLRKGLFLRLSDFVNEYDFEGFTYQPTDGFRGVHKMLRIDEGYPDLAKRADK